MSIFAIRADERVKNIYFTKEIISVDLMDGRTISVPLLWYPRLLAANSEQRAKWKICGGGYGIHWEEIDEDISTEGMLRGAPAQKKAFTRLKHDIPTTATSGRPEIQSNAHTLSGN